MLFAMIEINNHIAKMLELNGLENNIRNRHAYLTGYVWGPGSKFTTAQRRKIRRAMKREARSLRCKELINS